ncbi:nitric oxide synthase-interacting protein [Dermacentor albipictus]|uniref:nitric oxide synthase-interacting protein n=1 Tax=Dermacentor albipictus TaxID=60249 RepID=UPI0038FCA4D4
MTRHARNCTAGAVYTYHEKQKDTQSCGYGTQRMRLGKDAVKDFDCCCLSLQPCRNPVITPDGYLYDKECILEYIIRHKAENARLLKEYEAQQKRDAKELQELALAEERSKAESFVCKERTIVSTASTSLSMGSEDSPSVSNMVNGKDSQLPSFWVPSLTPSAKKDRTAKPKNVVLCPMSGKPIRAKDLIPVKFTPVVDPDEKAPLITRKARYMCAVTHDILGNSVPVAALRTSGNVVTMECVEKLLKKDWLDPTNSKPLKESDIIPLQRGGTGYSSTNLTLDAKVKKPVMTV